MEFDFLPNLPKSNLDDRTYKELVEECLLRIPRYCPEWTNHNAADPGITLIELFAWLTDQMLLRFNQVPRRNYVAFLELLGIRLHPPAPARTHVTFYLTRAQSENERIAKIPSGTEVGTERTETEDAIIFSTDHDLHVGLPKILHFITADQAESAPTNLRDDIFRNHWARDDEGNVSSRSGSFIFQERPIEGNCFYLVFDPDELLDGNVIQLTITGEPAGSTGIDPNHPPRSWQAWDGQAWQPVLRNEAHDGTYGFSFNAPGQQDHATSRQANVTLYMPLSWKTTTFSGFKGRWLRCVYHRSTDVQHLYERSPRFLALSARSIGGTAAVVQQQLIQEEILGESNGKPGQSFSLKNGNILKMGEIWVDPPGEPRQSWKQKTDFADSRPDDFHFTLDAVEGKIQFGPCIREPSQLASETRMRSQIQRQGMQPSLVEQGALDALGQQYGAVPPRGSVIRAAEYLTGGGAQGNVPKEQIRIIKSAVPYVARVVNYDEARHGADAETLDQAVIRVPKWLRTRNRAVTAEDFETLAYQASSAIARAHCPPNTSTEGVVDILLVPQVDRLDSDRPGISPSQLALSHDLKQDVLTYLKPRQLLGIAVQLIEPTYVGVSVQVEVGLDPQHNNPQARNDIIQEVQTSLYQFLNPLKGGLDGRGWPLGQALYRSDITGRLEQNPRVRYLGRVQLFTLNPTEQGWERKPVKDGEVDPGPRGLICSWDDPYSQTRHTVTLSGGAGAS